MKISIIKLIGVMGTAVNTSFAQLAAREVLGESADDADYEITADDAVKLIAAVEKYPLPGNYKGSAYEAMGWSQEDYLRARSAGIDQAHASMAIIRRITDF